MPNKKIVSRFATLLARKAMLEGRARIPITEVCEKTGLARATVDGYLHNTITRRDDTILITLCDYLECEPGDLLVIEEEEPRLVRMAYTGDEDTPVVPMRAIG